MGDLILFLLMIALFAAPLVLVVLDFIFFLRKKEKPIFELTAFFVGSVYMIMAYGLWDLPDYQTPINLYGFEHVHEPFSTEHLLALILFAVWGFFSYYILKFTRKSLPPLVEVFLLAGVYAGCVLSLVWCFQLACGARGPEKMVMSFLDYAIAFFLCVVPGIYLIHAVRLMCKLVKERAEKQESIHYENPVFQKLNLWFLKGANLFGAAFLMLLPMVFILCMVLVLFGQQPDSIILAFTKTSDWILSKEIAPPPVAYDTHYLCTVSLRGHRRLVKPIRYGVRHGERIVVNRQLCVANAFEQLIMERAPRFHRAVRSFYDTYGYPISKHINHAWAADLTYLIMKPLEWVFLLVLYLFDEKPEDRICSQYLPIGGFDGREPENES